MISDYENVPNSISRMKKLFKLIAVSFGLLCVLQAAANISLRLALYNSDGKIPESSFKNLTEERDKLRWMLSEHENKSQDLDARYNILITERDELIDLVKAVYHKQGWVYSSGSVYYISSDQKTWQDSREDCLHRGADLIIINSKEEHDFTKLWKANTWIGLTDSETEGTWKWVDGTQLNTSYWKDGEPNSYQNTDEDCAEVRYPNMENSWNDKPCSQPSFWICEKKVP